MVTGIHHRRLGAAVRGRPIAVCSPPAPRQDDEVGNNAVLARWLELEEVVPFGEYEGAPVGWWVSRRRRMSLGDLATRVEGVLQDQIIQMWPFGQGSVRQGGHRLRGAAFLLDQGAEAGVDVYLTGEVSHGAYGEPRSWDSTLSLAATMRPRRPA